MKTSIKKLLNNLGIRFRLQDLPLTNTHLVQFEKFTKNDLEISEWEFKPQKCRWSNKDGYIQYDLTPWLYYQLKPEVKDALKAFIENGNYHFGYGRRSVLDKQSYKVEGWYNRQTRYQCIFFVKEGATKKDFKEAKKKAISVAKRSLHRKDIKDSIESAMKSFLEKINNAFDEANKENIESNLSHIICDYVLKQIPKIPSIDLKLFSELAPYVKMYNVKIEAHDINTNKIDDVITDFCEKTIKEFKKAIREDTIPKSAPLIPADQNTLA